MPREWSVESECQSQPCSHQAFAALHWPADLLTLSLRFLCKMGNIILGTLNGQLIISTKDATAVIIDIIIIILLVSREINSQENAHN